TCADLVSIGPIGSYLLRHVTGKNAVKGYALIYHLPEPSATTAKRDTSASICQASNYTGLQKLATTPSLTEMSAGQYSNLVLLAWKPSVLSVIPGLHKKIVSNVISRERNF